MSPEQCRGIAAEVDHRTDIYALSIILHQMLAGKAPFASAGTGDVLIMHVSAPAAAGADWKILPCREVVEEAILRGLAKRREQRFQTMAELADGARAAGTAAPGGDGEPAARAAAHDRRARARSRR